MCGRVYIDHETAVLLQQYMRPDDYQRIKLGEGFPTDYLPVKTKLDIEAVKWGLKPSWSKQTLINARLETVATKDYFKNDFYNNRCVVMVSAYFEWSKLDDTKQKHCIKTKKPHFYLGGFLMEEKGEKRLIILTEPAQEDIAWIHHRMPVLLSQQEAVDYLNGKPDILKMNHHQDFVVIDS